MIAAETKRFICMRVAASLHCHHPTAFLAARRNRAFGLPSRTKRRETNTDKLFDFLDGRTWNRFWPNAQCCCVLVPCSSSGVMRMHLQDYRFWPRPSTSPS